MTGSPRANRIGVALRDPLPWAELLELAETAEDTGYDTLLTPESGAREAFATHAALAAATSRIRLGPGVVAVPSRSVLVLAMGAATVQEMSGGRFVLGVGTGTPGPRPLELMRRTVGALRDGFAGRPVQGERGAVPLGLVPSEPPPVYLAALGDRMIGLAGEVADGVLLNWCTPERVAEARELVRRGAERAGRDPGSVEVAVYVRACLGHEEDVALAALLEAASSYSALPHYRARFEAMGLGSEPTEALVRAVALFGDPSHARRRLADFREAGAELPVVYPVPALEATSSIMGTLMGLAPSPSLEP